jgi:hypothetical protein
MLGQAAPHGAFIGSLRGFYKQDAPERGLKPGRRVKANQVNQG